MTYEQERSRLSRRADEVFGPQEGATLMEHLPYGGWTEFVTKSDLRVLSAELRREIADSARRQTMTMFALMLTMLTVQTSVIVAFVS